MAQPPGSRKVGLQRILVATDFSEGAQRAVRRATRLPLAADATIHILHVLPEPGWRSQRIDAFLRRSARKVLAGVAAQASRMAKVNLSGVRITSALVQGKPSAGIVQRARGMKADLIVVGRHGQRSFRRLLIGSTAQRVVQRSDAPVLIVRRPPVGPYLQPLVALDDSPAARRAFRTMLRIVGPDTRSVHVARAFELPHPEAMRRPGALAADIRRYATEIEDSARRRAERLLAAHCPARLACHLHVRRGPARDAILREADRRGADLLVLGTHGRSGVRRAMFGSVAESVIQHARVDVLVAPAPRPPGTRA